MAVRIVSCSRHGIDTFKTTIVCVYDIFQKQVNEIRMLDEEISWEAQGRRLTRTCPAVGSWGQESVPGSNERCRSNQVGTASFVAVSICVARWFQRSLREVCQPAASAIGGHGRC